MRTKIVYCIISNEQDIYLEQAWVSVYTLRRYHADAHVVLLVDRATEATLTGKRAGIKALVTEVVAVDVPEEYSAMQRSRFLKTNFRQFLSGDLLFIDSDTVICGPLDDVDRMTADIAAVPDSHRPHIASQPYGEEVKRKLKTLFDMEPEDDECYFNAGVLYVKDNALTRSFFADWHEAWKYTSLVKHHSFDQPAFYATNRKYGHIVQELHGSYNCQLCYSLSYLHSARILHFFNIDMPFMNSEVSPFYSREFYRRVKECGGISGEVKAILDDTSRWLQVSSHVISGSVKNFLWKPDVGILFRSYEQHTLLYKVVRRLCGLDYMFNNLKNKLLRRVQ